MYATYDPGNTLYDPLFRVPANKKKPRPKKSTVQQQEQIASREAFYKLAIDFGTSMSDVYIDLINLRKFTDFHRLAQIFTDGERKMHVGMLLVFIAVLYLFCSL